MLNKEKIMNRVDPTGLLAEPTSEEMKEWEQSLHFSDNPYVLIGWLVNYRKTKMQEEFSKIYNFEDSTEESEVVTTLKPLDKN